MGLRNRLHVLGYALFGIFMLAQAAPCSAGEPEPAPIWSGVYAGAHGGYGWGNTSYTFDTFAGPEHFSHDFGNWIAGGHLGVQRQGGGWWPGSRLLTRGWTSVTRSNPSLSRAASVTSASTTW